MRAGNLNKDIAIYALTVARDAYNSAVESYSKVMDTKAEVTYLSGDKTVSNEEISYTGTVFFTIRYRAGVIETMRVLFRGQTFEITYIQEIGIKEGLRLTTTRMQDGIFLTPTAAPTSFSAATASDDSIELTWTNNSSGDAITIERSLTGNLFIEIHRTGLNLHDSVSTYIDDELTEGLKYFYRIRAFNNFNYSDYTAVDEKIVGGDIVIVVNIPTNLTATVASDTSLDLTWELSEPNSGTEVYRLDNGVYSLIYTTAADEVAYTNTGLSAGNTYYYKVKSIVGTSSSEFSDIGFNTTSVTIGYEDETLALVARFTTPPTTALKDLIDKTIKSIKTAGVWTKLDVLYMMNMYDEQSAQRNWKADAFNLNPVGSPVFTAKYGYVGATAKYLETGWIPNDSALVTTTGSHTSFVMWKAPVATAIALFGCSSSATAMMYMNTYTTGADRYYLMANSYNGSGDIQTMYFNSYTSSGINNYYYQNGWNKTTNATYVKIDKSTQPMVLSGNNASGVYTGTAVGLMNWMAGSLLDDAEVLALSNAVRYFNANVENTF